MVRHLKVNDIQFAPERRSARVVRVPALRVARKVRVRRSIVLSPERKAVRVDPERRVPAVRQIAFRRARVVLPVVRATINLLSGVSAPVLAFPRLNRASRSMRASLLPAAVRSWKSATPKASASCIRFVRAQVRVRVGAWWSNSPRQFSVNRA